jgi:hypothetical protein
MRRGLCEHEWAAKHPNGTADEFKEYYGTLTKNEIKVRRVTIVATSPTPDA